MHSFIEAIALWASALVLKTPIFFIGAAGWLCIIVHLWLAECAEFQLPRRSTQPVRGISCEGVGFGRRSSLRLLQLLKSIQVLNGQFHRSATRERPPDVAGHAAGEPLAAIVDLNERLFALTAVVGRLARPFLFCARTETLEGGYHATPHAFR